MCLLLTLLFEFQENKSDLENFEPEKIMHCSNNECVIRKVSFVCFFLWEKKKKNVYILAVGKERGQVGIHG